MASVSTTSTSHPWFFDRHQPIYGFQFPPEFSLEELQAFCIWFAGWYARQRTPMAMIADLSQMRSASSVQRRAWANFEKGSAADIKRVAAGVAVVLTNPMVRGVVTAVYWINPPVYPHNIVANRQQALAWCQQMLDGRTG